MKEGSYLQFKSRLKTSQLTVLQGESCRDPGLEDIKGEGACINLQCSLVAGSTDE